MSCFVFGAIIYLSYNFNFGKGTVTSCISFSRIFCSLGAGHNCSFFSLVYWRRLWHILSFRINKGIDKLWPIKRTWWRFLPTSSYHMIHLNWGSFQAPMAARRLYGGFLSNAHWILPFVWPQTQCALFSVSMTFIPRQLCQLPIYLAFL